MRILLPSRKNTPYNSYSAQNGRGAYSDRLKYKLGSCHPLMYVASLLFLVPIMLLYGYRLTRSDIERVQAELKATRGDYRQDLA
jgi:hypothetical protein